MPDSAGFHAFIKKLRSNEALTYGVTEAQRARLVTKKAKANGAAGDVIARDEEHFRFAEGQPGIMMFDYDPRPGYPPESRKSREELDVILREVVPGWATTERLWRASSTAFVYNNGEELIGSGGWRAYCLVDDASAIPMLGAAIYQRLWEAGHGYVHISDSGALLDRSIVDASVWQASRLDFAAPPVMGPGLKRLTPRDMLLPGEPVLRTTDLIADCLPLSEWRRTSPELRDAKRAIKPEAEKVRRRFVKERTESLKHEGFNVDPRVIERAVTQQVLEGTFVLCAKDGSKVAVGELLADPVTYDKQQFHDPLEPDFDDPRIATAFLSGGNPCIYSFIHGGIRYALGNDDSEAKSKPNGADAQSKNDAGCMDSPESSDSGGREESAGDAETAGEGESSVEADEGADGQPDNVVPFPPKKSRDGKKRAGKNENADDGTAWDEYNRECAQVTARINKRHAFIHSRGGRACVLHEGFDENGNSKEFYYRLPDFHDIMCNRLDLLVVSPKGKQTPGSQVWQAHPDRRSYQGVTFNPSTTERDAGDYYNLYRGFTVEPKRGVWHLLRHHIHDVLAAGDDEVDEYIIRWLAWAMQNPDKPAEVALVFKGPRGCGKGTLGNPLVRLYGQHGLHLSSTHLLTGRFSGHFEKVCFVFADESLWAGDKAGEQQLKRLITEPTLTIEGKHRDAYEAPNRLKIIMASNENWVAPVGPHERRFVISDVSPARVGDKGYFAAIHHETANGGLEAMLHDLKEMDLAGFHPRRDLPETEAIKEQARRSLPPEMKWLLSLLQKGRLPNPTKAADRTTLEELHESARHDIGRKKEVGSQDIVTFIKEWNVQKVRTNTGNVWEFPPLAEMRAKFDREYGKQAWDEPFAWVK